MIDPDVRMFMKRARPEQPGIAQGMPRWIRDWWRGWSDEDLANVLTKIKVQEINPGAIITVTRAELEAYGAYQNGYRFQYVSADQL